MRYFQGTVLSVAKKTSTGTKKGMTRKHDYITAFLSLFLYWQLGVIESLCGFAIFDGFSTMVVVDAQYLLYRHTVGVGLAAAVTDRPERDASSTSKFPEGNGVNRSLIASSPYKQRKLLYCF